MPKEHEGGLQGMGLRIAIVAARFNEHITGRLLQGARTALNEHKVREEDTLVAWVPGSFELPLVAHALAGSGRYDAVVCLGAVIRGETAHFEHISRVASDGIAQASRDTGVPILLGVLTTHTLAQALERSGGQVGNAGYNVTVSAIQMANLLKELKLGRSPA
ncbi:MAG: 6,7-dimethyl-8-ribityllumazine synthase [Dehalococcoidia bacterium]|nr:6,7-dimethyl-8-ribityllumazine synthase [Dehalococcoidia bacterium]